MNVVRVSLEKAVSMLQRIRDVGYQFAHSVEVSDQIGVLTCVGRSVIGIEVLAMPAERKLIVRRSAT